MNRKILSSWPIYSSEEQDAVQAVLASGSVNYWTGDQGKLFESEYANFCGCQYGIALANGTLALELALRTAGVGPGDEVVVTSRTFIASASAIVMVGATPVFADVDFESQNITAGTISAVVSNRTRAIVCVHLGGWPCDMDPIMDLAGAKGLTVIEDCAQAHGAEYKGSPVGSLGDIGVFSFCQDKIISTGGEGGMMVTNNEDYWKRAWAFKDHGKDWDEVNRSGHPPGFRWLHNSIGSNYRMTEMQAAIGRIQLQKLEQWREIRKNNALIINRALQNCKLARIPSVPEQVVHAYYKHYVFINSECFKPGWDRTRLMNGIGEAGVPCFSGSCSEVYLEKAFKSLELGPRKPLPVASELGDSSLMFLVHPTITNAEMVKAAGIISAEFKRACIDR
ncbi:MAG: DegT/DnrJ/EryC1/StrS aminotransferase family protein [Motiliproteus sp.]|nr:DegT/DnrJ/EryC1/StrS aminotransferase family protein [Motiliproteus sp.]MCW9053470.1 DegT/DnrJ/EryC1/StrS aminotransferase family protein [Motiliproteus sp.]